MWFWTSWVNSKKAWYFTQAILPIKPKQIEIVKGVQTAWVEGIEREGIGTIGNPAAGKVHAVQRPVVWPAKRDAAKSQK